MNGLLKIGTLFSGIGSPEFALQKLNVNFESNFACEIDEYARLSFLANHKIDKNNFHKDIYSINPNDLPKNTELLVAGFPCFTAGHKINLENGIIKNIEDIQLGDYVLTHKNRYRKVVIPMKKTSNHIFKIKTLDDDKILEVTAEHPFYVIHKNVIGIDIPEWIEAKDLDKNKHWLLKHNTLKQFYTLKELSNIDVMEESIRNMDKSSTCGLYELIEIESIELEYKEIEVYNFEVEEDNSYVVENIIVHNCQAFSSAGRGEGINDSRGRGILYLEMMRIVENILPNVVLFENVKGITFSKHDELRKDLYRRLETLGYYFNDTILNTYKVTGIPQSRNRWFLVGFRDKEKFNNFKFPEENAELLDIKKFIEVENEVDSSFYDSEYRFLKNFFINLKDGSDGYISSFTASREYTGFKNYSPTLLAQEYKCPKCIKTKPLNYIKSNFIENGFDYLGYKKYIEENLNIKIEEIKLENFDLEIAKQYGFNYDKFKTFYRKITPREALNLQGFPQDFIQVVSNLQLTKQAGNSMTVDIMAKLIEEILKVYKY